MNADADGNPDTERKMTLIPLLQAKTLYINMKDKNVSDFKNHMIKMYQELIPIIHIKYTSIVIHTFNPST